MRTLSIPSNILEHWKENSFLEEKISEIKRRFQVMLRSNPEVTVVIPAYNEEETILKTLSSLSCTHTTKAIEVIVVNNNSKDRTEYLAKAAGVICVREYKQGIKYARNAGLAMARGKYVLQADADTIYPPEWIDKMVEPLINNSAVALTYSSFSFIPIGSTGRFTYYLYERIADLSRKINNYVKDEAVNVYGFSMGFRKEQGVAVDGFNFPPGAGEDGWFALKLRRQGFGYLHFISRRKIIAWTTDRRIQIDGGMWKGIFKRLKRVLTRA